MLAKKDSTMIDQHFRPQYQRILVNPVAPWLSKRMTANQVTILSGFLGLLILPALMFNQVYCAISLLLLSGYFDTLDGTIARLTNLSSDWGSVLDIMTDRVVEIAVVFALWAIAPDERSLGCLFMLGSMLFCISSFLVVGIFKPNDSVKSFYYSPGLMERAEAFGFFIAMMLWPQTFVFLALLFTLLVSATAIARLREFRQMLNTH